MLVRLLLFVSLYSIYVSTTLADFQDTLNEVQDIIAGKYVKNVDTETLQEGALHGIVHALDPYSSFFTPNEYNDFKTNTSGEFGGIGLEMTKGLKDSFVTVTNVNKDSPAYQAGILIGDIIMSVNGEKIYSASLSQISKKIRGPRHTKITIGIFRPSDNKHYEFEMTRDNIEIDSVTAKMLTKNIGYIEIRFFNQKSYKYFLQHLLHLKQNYNLKGLIIDVRNNPGGLLESAVNVTNLFLKSNQLITTVVGKDGVKLSEYRANGKKIAIGDTVKIVVLTNRGSASAAEILTAALKENKIALVVGEKTFGKASVQEIIELKSMENAAVKLTIARYYTPLGNMIHDVGIEPDLVIVDERTKAGGDKILENTIDFINKS